MEKSRKKALQKINPKLAEAWTSKVLALGEMGRYKDQRVREGATAILGKIRDPRAVEPLIEVLKDEDWSLRWWSAWALGITGDKRAVRL